MKVGVVGCGKISGFHINGIRTADGAELVALCDSNETILNETKENFEIPATYTSFDKMLKEQKLDVVHILTPPTTHKDLAIKALNAGCHVLVEKPLALTLADANRMLDVAEKKGVKLCVNHNMVYEPVIMKAFDMVNNYAFGKLVHMDVYFIFDMNRIVRNLNVKEDGSIQHWFSDLKGKLMQDLAPHPFSILLKFIREYDHATVLSKKVDAEIDIGDTELRMLVEAKDITANVMLSLRAMPDNVLVNLYGTKMSLRVDPANRTIIKQKLPGLLPKAIGRGVDNMMQSMQIGFQTVVNTVKFALGKASDAEAINHVIHEFYRSINSESLPPVTGYEAKQVVKMMNEVWK